MVVKVVATPCLHLSPKKTTLSDAVFVSRNNWLRTMSSKLSRTRSFEHKSKQRAGHYSIRRTCSASFDNSFGNDDDFANHIRELTLKFQSSDENSSYSDSIKSESESDWNSSSIEMKANSVDLPLSLRMIKRKKNQLKKDLSSVGESAYCSIKKAFSSMVFIIRELHSFSLQMREALFYEDLQGILVKVQSEMHASFVWLFQQVFSHTPTLMVYIMILLANFTVHSMSNSVAFAAVTPPSIVTTVENRENSNPAVLNFDNFKSIRITSSSHSSGSKTTSVGGSNGGRNNVKPIASGMDGDNWMKFMKSLSANVNRPIVTEDESQFASREEESVSGQEELAVWNSILDEASRMQGKVRDESLDSDVTKWFVSPVTAKIETDDHQDYFKTELFYQTELAQEPNNVLLLANYAQFLYLVVHDYDRAEEHFKRAIDVEPKDGEAHSKYANFLWQVRNDLWAAEETYLEAISADPTNSFYAANYAHFLWNTGGEDTCYPLDSPEDETLDA